jgi:hypothetical protein
MTSNRINGQVNEPKFGLFGSIYMITVFLIDLYILYKLINMNEKCNCAVTKIMKKLKNTIMVLLIIVIINIFAIQLIAHLFRIEKIIKGNAEAKMISIIFSIISALSTFALIVVQFYYAYLLINYSNELIDNTNCNCISEDTKNFLNIYGWIRMIIIALPFFVIILAILLILLSIGEPLKK